ncbi:MAG UNVERIFIED_CONTAM: baseplate J/gp47 family protein [Microcystis novacekii LVE1205-3]
MAILGIKRGEPEFAEGTITFERDIGQQDIEVPWGTLVATPETPTSPKKVYQTIENKLFPQGTNQLRGENPSSEPGEAQVTPAETLTVLPRPLPGIQSRQQLSILLVSRASAGNTDEELRNGQRTP